MTEYMGFFSASRLQFRRHPPRASRTSKPMNLMENVFRRTLPIDACCCVHRQRSLATTHSRSSLSAAGSAPAPPRPLRQRSTPGGEANLVIPDLELGRRSSAA